MEIVKLEPHDVDYFEALIGIFRDVFEVSGPTPDPGYIKGLLNNPDFMVFVVKLGQRIVGGLTIYVLHHYYQTQPIAFIYDVGISPGFQGKGYGKALVAHVRKHCFEHGFAELFVEAEADDTDAIGFYRKTKSDSEMRVVQFSYKCNSLTSKIYP
jgi:aminoglycoside 3-N-acetyltransferase I